MVEQRAKSKEQVVKETLPSNPPLGKGGRRGGNEKGIALIMALIIGLVALVILTGIIYFVIQSVAMSGAGKRYATASEAADGSVEVMKDAINLILMGEPVSSLPIVDASPPCLVNSILTEGVSCTTTLTLPGPNLFTGFTANITVERLYSKELPGGRLEFAGPGGGAPTTSVYYRINTVVTGPGGTRAESSALYRYTM
jgi:hypothetical protein